jgi:hypothetical protein
MDFQQAALAICGTTAVYIWYKRSRISAISDVPGPKNPSWIYGISVSPTLANDITSQIPGRTPMVVAM